MPENKKLQYLAAWEICILVHLGGGIISPVICQVSSTPLRDLNTAANPTRVCPSSPDYYDEGFLAIQHAVDMAIAEYISGVDPRSECNTVLYTTSITVYIT